MECSSPFDQAATAPIMHMRSKKRVSSCSNSTMSTRSSCSSICSSFMSPSSTDLVSAVNASFPSIVSVSSSSACSPSSCRRDLNDGGDSLCSSSQYQEHFGFEATTSNIDNESDWTLQQQQDDLQHQQPTSLMMMTMLTQEQIDLAILRERHNDIQQINSSMKQINEIQKSLAMMVDAQSEHVDQLEKDTMQSLEHASEGVSQILAMQKQQQQPNCSNRGGRTSPPPKKSAASSSLPNKKNKMLGRKNTTPSSSSDTTTNHCRVFYRNPWGLGYLSPTYF